MSTIALAAGAVAATGFLCALVLAIASKVMAVKVDEDVARLRKILPGVNCGACGYSGCDSYAAALAHDGAKVNVCLPGGNTVSKEISEILGVAAEDVVPKTAFVHCGGDDRVRKRKMDYSGIRTCYAEKQLYGGQNACVFGCLGYGDCVAVCPEGAICVENGLARVDPRKCMGCGLCAKVCPNKVIFVEFKTTRVTVRCKNPEKGAIVRKKCSSGCIGCMKCVRECPEQAITANGNLAVIDYEKCVGCRTCADACVTKCIQRI